MSKVNSGSKWLCSLIQKRQNNSRLCASFWWMVCIEFVKHHVLTQCREYDKGQKLAKCQWFSPQLRDDVERRRLFAWLLFASSFHPFYSQWQGIECVTRRRRCQSNPGRNINSLEALIKHDSSLSSNWTSSYQMFVVEFFFRQRHCQINQRERNLFL